MIIYLTLDQILFIHTRLIKKTGGSSGLRDIGLLESALARPHSTFAGQNLYPDIFSKAAALMQSLIKNHPFIDGNKRTGITSTVIFLQQNGYRLNTTNDDVESFTLQVAQGEHNVEVIATWLKSNCQLN